MSFRAVQLQPDYYYEGEQLNPLVHAARPSNLFQGYAILHCTHYTCGPKDIKYVTEPVNCMLCLTKDPGDDL